MIRVDSCVCVMRSFADLRSEAIEHGLSLPQLCRRTGAGERCGMCRPYLQRSLGAGQVVFHELLPADGEGEQAAA